MQTELFDASGSGVPGAEGTGPRVAFGLGGEPDFTPAGTLNTGELAAFRSQGWTCPELQELGFHLIWARAGVISGDEVLELRLTDGRHFATVLEQHASDAGARGAPRTRTGRRFAHQRADRTHRRGRRLHPGQGRHAVGRPEPGNGFLWVNPAPPYRAIYPDVGGDIHVHFWDLPAEQADDGVAALTRVSSGTPVPASHNGIPERIERGLSRILERLAP